jgi:hypothetical protein
VSVELTVTRDVALHRDGSNNRIPRLARRPYLNEARLDFVRQTIYYHSSPAIVATTRIINMHYADLIVLAEATVLSLATINLTRATCLPNGFSNKHRGTLLRKRWLRSPSSSIVVNKAHLLQRYQEKEPRLSSWAPQGNINVGASLDRTTTRAPGAGVYHLRSRES